MIKNIVCFGDSNTFGADMENSGRLPFEARWTGVLANLLGSDFAIKEEGQNGRTAAIDDETSSFELNGLKSLPACLDAHSPVYLLAIMLGTNDVKEIYGQSAEQIAQGLEKLIVCAKNSPSLSDSKNILIISPPHIGEGYKDTFIVNMMGTGCVQKSQKLAPLYKKLAEDMDCYFLDASKHASAGTFDHVHLSRDGHASLGQAVANFIKQQPLLASS